MFDRVCDIIFCFEAAMRVKSNAYGKVVIENQKKENMEI